MKNDESKLPEGLTPEQIIMMVDLNQRQEDRKAKSKKKKSIWKWLLLLIL